MTSLTYYQKRETEVIFSGKQRGLLTMTGTFIRVKIRN
jgi:hypothetical protein